MPRAAYCKSGADRLYCRYKKKEARGCEPEKEVPEMKRVFLTMLFFILAVMTMAVACSGGQYRRSGCNACSIGCAACTACTVVNCVSGCIGDGY